MGTCAWNMINTARIFPRKNNILTAHKIMNELQQGRNCHGVLYLPLLANVDYKDFLLQVLVDNFSVSVPSSTQTKLFR
ncbi:unnamed protein product [Allacma fusca]|uniref:Uncharacterized protein n=1 Tax=Allacma fusca TaxID=39272 RepID=A0A8J2KSZ5_9HEXA|nr:unnamed protein product [Allacma fusca]